MINHLLIYACIPTYDVDQSYHLGNNIQYFPVGRAIALWYT